MATAPPILIWQPGGGVPVGPVSNPPVYSQAGTTQLVEDQAYIDVVFGSVQTTDEWVLVECVVVNEIDAAPLNIWPGIITDKTAAGFRLQLNGLPDSGNYYLHWAVSGINITPGPATTYYLTGPTTGNAGAELTYTVHLPPSTTVSGTVTVTPSDGGAGGSFNVPSVTLSSASASATFIYTPASYGTITISTTNSSSILSDPAGIVLTTPTPTYALTGPTTGDVGVASTNFTVTLTGGVAGTLHVTPAQTGTGTAGTFTPTSVSLTTGAPSATFTYTPGSGGTKTISVTDDGGLVDPGSISYVAVVPFTGPGSVAGLQMWLKADAIAGPPADGTAVGTWADSSGNGNDVTQATAGLKPLFKTNRINGLPALKFDGVDDTMLSVAIPGGVTTTASIFIVQRKNVNSGTLAMLSMVNPFAGSPPTNTFEIYLPFSDGTVYFDLGDSTATGRINAAWGGNFTNFFVWSFVAGSGNMAIYRNGTTVVSSGGHTNTFNPTGLFIAINNGTQDADVAEVLIYSTALSTTDRTNVENWLKTKYGL